MNRTLFTDLTSWLKGRDRKPLVIRGARQVGKTWIVREFARKSGLNLIEINFERHPEYASLFKSTSPEEVIVSIERQTGIGYHEKKTLLFLDEIQKAPHAFANLRWFYEEKPNLPVIATGSLLDFILRDHEFSMPVGRIAYLFLEPMSFQEFLAAHKEDIAIQYLESLALETSIEDALHLKFMTYFRDYLLVGGMPAAIQSWIDFRSPAKVGEIHQNLLNTYVDDFNKYAGRIPTDRLQKIFRYVPRLLGKKFKYANVDREERSKALKQALDALCMARICHRVTSSHGRGIPLAAEGDERTFKIIFVDVGLVSSILGMVLKDSEKIEEIIRVNEGGIAEQVVGQILRTVRSSYVDPTLHYYVREQKGSEAELDYLLQIGTHIVPIEVKSGTTGQLRSLHQFMAERQFQLAVRINTEKPSFTRVDLKTTKGDRARYQLVNLPFYLTSEIVRISKQVLTGNGAKL